MKNILILTFLVGALWDIILRKYALTPDLPWKKQDFAVAFIPYFKRHSIIKAAVYAGLICLFTQSIILGIIGDRLFH